jgi:hypothetical protein
MGKRLYVGNLPFSMTEAELRELFAAHGDVVDVHLVNDRETGRPRGFGFVTLGTEEAAAAAARALNEKTVGGRPLVVNEARERGAGPPPHAAGPPRARGPAPREGGAPPPRGAPRPAPRPPAAPVMQDPGELPEEPRRRSRGATKKVTPDRDRASKSPRLREEEDEGGGASNWRELLDDGEDQDVSLLDWRSPDGEEPDEDVVEEDDWRRYVDAEEDEGEDEDEGGGERER